MNQDITDRFSETSPASSRVDRDEDGYPEQTLSAAGPQCQNCGKTVDFVGYVEGFDYWGCNECHEEAMAVIARELAEERMRPAVPEQKREVA